MKTQKPTVRYFEFSHFSEAVLCSSNKILVKQTPEWRMFGIHPQFGRFVAKWFKDPSTGFVVCATQF